MFILITNIPVFNIKLLFSSINSGRYDPFSLKKAVLYGKTRPLADSR